MPPENVVPIHRGGGVQPISGDSAAIKSGSVTFSVPPISSEVKPEVPNSSDGVSRPELTAHLAALEARVETQVTRIEAKIDRAAEGSRVAAEAALAMAREAKQASLDTAKDVRDGNKSQRYWMIGTAVAVVCALWGVNQAFIGNTIMAFESGKATATAIQQATDQQKAIADQQRELADQQKRLMEAVMSRLGPAPALTSSAASSPK